MKTELLCFMSFDVTIKEVNSRNKTIHRTKTFDKKKKKNIDFIANITAILDTKTPFFFDEFQKQNKKENQNF